jgi:hypothetical protein
MRITITDSLVSRTAQDGQAVPFTVKTWDDSTEPWALLAPTTLRYRVDNPDTGDEILAWTSGSASSSQTLTIAGADNTPAGCDTRYRRQITVQVNAGLSTVAVATRDYWIRDLAGVS